MDPRDSGSSQPHGEPPSPGIFRADVNAYLRHLARAYDGCLAAGNDGGVRAALAEADAARRALSVQLAVHRLFLADGGPVRAARVGADAFSESGGYLVGLVGRMWDVVRRRDGAKLMGLVVSGEECLEVMAAGGGGAFAEIEDQGLGGIRNVGTHVGGAVEGNVDDVEGVPTAEEMELGGSGGRWRLGGSGGRGKGGRGTVAEAATREKRAQRRREKRPLKVCGLVWADLHTRQKWTIVIYLTMVTASLVAAGLITKDFVEGVRNPEAVLRIDSLDRIRQPILTACTSIRGLPQSRLQFFNYSDAAGNVYVGADPRGPQAERASAEFESVVERWFDNPEGEDCLATVGDFFPLPIDSLNGIANGTKTTRCRPCYRTGGKGKTVDVTSTAFEDASFSSFYIDTYFLQCLHVVGGPEPKKSLPFMQNSIFNFRTKMQRYGLLSSSVGIVADLTEDAFKNFTAAQACSLLFFSYFPRDLNRTDPNVDIRYRYDGPNWTATGIGPYFTPPSEARSLLPQESIELYVSTAETTPAGRLPTTSDVALIGPNSQAFLRLRPVKVFGVDRYDVSVSSSNYVEDSLTPIFGYWRLMLIYSGFPRLIRDSIVESNTYPVAQWAVDFLGYFGLFTGLSFFSLLLVPVLASMRRNERRRLREERPEAFVWSKYRRLANWRAGHDPEVFGEGGEPDVLAGRTRGIYLP